MPSKSTRTLKSAHRNRCTTTKNVGTPEEPRMVDVLTTPLRTFAKRAAEGKYDEELAGYAQRWLAIKARQRKRRIPKSSWVSAAYVPHVST